MNVLDWITDAVVTTWELIGLIFRSGIANAAILQDDEDNRADSDRDPGHRGYPSTPRGAIHQARFA